MNILHKDLAHKKICNSCNLRFLVKNRALFWTSISEIDEDEQFKFASEIKKKLHLYWGKSSFHFLKDWIDFFQICEGDNLERENSFYLRGSDSPTGPSR